jgi:D-inositol-3-phosphate glycosyltransferase
MLPLDRLPAKYRGARAVLLPSEAEGYGLTVVEGALCGIPAIVARSGALTELVAHERTGLVVALGDPAAWAEAMLRLARNPGEARRFGDEARARARSRTAGALAERLAAVYAEATRA